MVNFEKSTSFDLCSVVGKKLDDYNRTQLSPSQESSPNYINQQIEKYFHVKIEVHSNSNAPDTLTNRLAQKGGGIRIGRVDTEGNLSWLENDEACMESSAVSIETGELQLIIESHSSEIAMQILRGEHEQRLLDFAGYEVKRLHLHITQLVANEVMVTGQNRVSCHSGYCLVSPENPITNKNIYVVSPHPDDSAIACGGLIAESCKPMHGNQVMIAVATTGARGVIGDSEDGGDIRRAEADKEARILGSKIRHLELPLYNKQSSPDFREDIAQMVSSLSDAGFPDLIFIPNDSDHHLTHRLVALVTIKALLRIQASEKKSDYQPTILMYEAPSGPIKLGANNTYYIGRNLEQKRGAVMAHVSQNDRVQFDKVAESRDRLNLAYLPEIVFGTEVEDPLSGKGYDLAEKYRRTIGSSENLELLVEIFSKEKPMPRPPSVYQYIMV